MSAHHYDCIIIGSGFGGSVSALRLAEKGYSVLVIEKGRRFRPEDFPKTNWDFKHYMWRPELGMRGILQMSFFEHVTVLHGVGVGGGSLGYANTLPTPSESFFTRDSWAHLADWQTELGPHYETAIAMLGAAENPHETPHDRALLDIARDLGRESQYARARVGVFFGKSGHRVADPYFHGRGPERVGCTHCGACMTGCRVGAKNTLDRNYLYLAEQLGVRVLAETEVTAVRPRPGVEASYVVETRSSMRPVLPGFGGRRGRTFSADRVIFAAGVLGTVPLLLRLRADADALPELSARVGDSVRTNNEALIGIIAPDCPHDLTEGVTISSILHTDEHSHLEPVHFGKGSDMWRALALPHAPDERLLTRLGKALVGYGKAPRQWLQVLTRPDLSEKLMTLLYMRTLESTLSLRLEGRRRKRLVTVLDDPDKAPKAFMDEANDLADRFIQKLGGGVQVTLLTELLRGSPSTAHILGGASMGSDADSGVIDSEHRVFGYDGLYVIDGSSVSANPGVNPSLTITALAERAMSLIPAKNRAAAAAD